MRPKLKVSCVCPTLRYLLPFSDREIANFTCPMLAELAKECPGFTPKAEIIFINDKQMQELNKNYLNCPGPTNTLAFEGQDKNMGQVYFSLETYNRECTLYGQKKTDHAISLLAHAIVHLAGVMHGQHMDLLCDRLIHTANKKLTS